MGPSILLDQLHAALGRGAAGSSRNAVLDRFRDMMTTLVEQAEAPATPERTRAKILLLLDHLGRAHEKLGSRIFQTAFLLNVLGEGVARANLISRPVVECLQVGLYFFGLDQIEKRWSARAAVYSGVHADHLGTYLGRASLKSLVREARERMEGGRIFCLTYHYLNSLRKAYWKYCRESEDALDVAITGESEEVRQPVVMAPGETAAASDRVSLMLDIFRRALTGRQRWIYLAKNRSALYDRLGPPGGLDEHILAALLGEEGGKAPPGDLGWTQIAGRLGINEKTAKREYLRTLHTLLNESAQAVFGSERIPSNYVRRVLEQIRTIVYEKDLRIRSSTGRGLNTLVEKWEVALRFVLNHDRVSASA